MSEPNDVPSSNPDPRREETSGQSPEARHDAGHDAPMMRPTMRR